MRRIGKFFFVILVWLLATIGVNVLLYGFVGAFHNLDQDQDAAHLVTLIAMICGVIISVIYFRGRRARLAKS